jgi:SAM-dependent methyltransferase
MNRFSSTPRHLQQILPSLASLFADTMSTPKKDPVIQSLPNPNYIPRQPDFRRQDESPDSSFYRSPRFVHHIDEAAQQDLKDYYAANIRPESCIVDICSSWTSHLPDFVPGKLPSAVGYGLNAAELKANKHLRRWYVRDLNTDPNMHEVEDGIADAVICNVSIDYLTQPVKIVDEMRRMLKSGGMAHLSFSDRCFPDKVISRWLRMGDEERRLWVGGYFWASGGWEHIEEVILTESGGYQDPLFVIRARKQV